MKELNHLESLLHSWMPCHPSASLREKLFPVAADVRRRSRECASNPPSHVGGYREGSGRKAFSWNWLAPVTVCAFTMLVVLGGRPHSGAHFGAPDTNLFFASMTMSSIPAMNSEPSTAYALTIQDLNLEQNVWREAIFESTKLAQTHSSKRPLPLGRTNSLTL